MNKLSTVAKIRMAFSKRNLLATTIGAIKGGAIPFGTFALYHLEMNGAPWQPKGVIVLGGLIYSAKTVYGWCKQVFRKEDGEPDTLKALGWCVGIEGFMTVSSTFWLNVGALVLLILVNAVATGVSLAMEDEAAKAAVQPSAVAAAEITTTLQATRATHVAMAAEITAELAAVRAEVAALQAKQPPTRKRSTTAGGGKKTAVKSAKGLASRSKDAAAIN